MPNKPKAAAEPKPHKLSANDKQMLKHLAIGLMRGIADKMTAEGEKAAEKLKAEREKFALSLLKNRWKASDLAVLKKFHAAIERNTISFGVASTTSEDSIQQGIVAIKFELSKSIETPRHLNRSEYHGYDAVIGITRAEYDRIKKLTDEAAAIRTDIVKEIEQRKSAYFALIDASKTYEQVLDVWPEAEQLRNNILGETPVLLVPDSIRNTIAADMRERAKLKALPAPAQTPRLEILPPLAAE